VDDLIYLSFVGLRLPTGKTTVMHLVAREHLPEPNSQSELLRVNCGIPIVQYL